MKNRNRFLSLLIPVMMLALAAMGCQLASRVLGGAEITPITTAVQVVPFETPTESPSGDAAPTSLPPTDVPPTAAPPTEAPPEAQDSPQPPAAQPEPGPCAEDVCIESGTFLLQRPLAPGGRITVDPSNRFGEYMRSTRSANLGAGFLNSTGAPVVAAAAGQVVVAGDDSRTSYAQRPNLYGNLVILEHSLPGINQPVYTLYAHLSEVSVAVGDNVEAGQEIGKVGMSGNVSGSTLHFEVRLGENSPDAARNPDLWLAPLSDEDGQPSGALAGRIVDSDGDFVEMGNIVLERLAGPGQPAVDQLYIRSYTSNDLTGQPPWGESFAVGELPAGEYQVSFWLGGMQQQTVRVEPGRLTLVNFRVK